MCTGTDQLDSIQTGVKINMGRIGCCISIPISKIPFISHITSIGLATEYGYQWRAHGEFFIYIKTDLYRVDMYQRWLGNAALTPQRIPGSKGDGKTPIRIINMEWVHLCRGIPISEIPQVPHCICGLVVKLYRIAEAVLVLMKFGFVIVSLAPVESVTIRVTVNCAAVV
jgi:hypothetical protein